MDKAVEIKNSGESEDEKFRRKLELQHELDILKREERPWLELTDAEKRTFMCRDDSVEPVRLAEEMTGFERFFFRRMGRSRPGVNEAVPLVIDFAKGPEALVASFRRLLTRMHEQGRVKLGTKRGRPLSFKLRLFGLSVYRCHRLGLELDEVWEHLASANS